MPYAWTDWQADPAAQPGAFATPCVDWYRAAELGAASGGQGLAFFSQPGLSRIAGLAEVPGEVAGVLPLPPRTRPAGDTAIPLPDPRPSGLTGIAQVPGPDAVILGVIDAGIALAHDRFRRSGGAGTRILSAWLQGGAWAGQAHLPFGRELMQAEIDARMAAATGPDGRVDEAGFNRAAGLADFADPFAERWTETAAPHGTHVMDMAGGFDSRAAAAEVPLRDRLALVTVELAPRPSIGPAGSFLEPFVIWAVRHVLAVADAIWSASHAHDPVHAARGGFPVVINLSYGLLAGPADGTADLAKYLAHLQATRPAGAPLRVLLPAGNDNLSEGAARMDLAPGTSGQLAWRHLPEDRTSNYAEVWAPPQPGPAPAAAAHPLALALAAPDGTGHPPAQGTAGQRRDLIETRSGETLARIYCRASHDAPLGQPASAAASHRMSYTLAVAPTWRALRPGAPAGAWLMTLEPAPDQPALTARLRVQSDQELRPVSGGVALASRFDDPAYIRFGANGAEVDTYRYDRVTGAVTMTDSTGTLRRRGTMNALAGSAAVLTVGGWRACDGLPAGWSSSGDDGGPAPDAAAVSDDGVWRSGRMAAGGRSGSAAVMQGTSFAVAEASRTVAARLAAWLDAGAAAAAPDTPAAFQAVAAVADAAAVPPHPFPAGAMPLKLGAGRMPMAADHGRPPR